MSEATNSPALTKQKDKVVSKHVEVHLKHTWSEEDADDMASELNSHFQDFRPLDNYYAEVVTETTPVCSLCEEEWDPIKDEESGVLVCAYCGVPVAK
jgi:hypothetical protein